VIEMTKQFKGLGYSLHDLTFIKKLEAQIITKRLQDNLDQTPESKKLKTYCKIMEGDESE
jgi:hypothetical protein